MLGRFLAVGVPVALCAAVWLVCGTGVAEAKAPKRLPLGRLDGMSGTWSITVTDCTACVVSSQRNGQLDVLEGIAEVRQTAFDVVNSLNESVNIPGRQLPASGALWVGGDVSPQCDGPDFQETSGPTTAQLTIPFTRAGDQAEFSWILPVCDNGSHGITGIGIDGFPARTMPARVSVPSPHSSRSFATASASSAHRAVRHPRLRPLQYRRGPLARHDLLRRHPQVLPPLHPPAQRRPRLLLAPGRWRR